MTFVVTVSGYMFPRVQNVGLFKSVLFYLNNSPQSKEILFTFLVSVYPDIRAYVPNHRALHGSALWVKTNHVLFHSNISYSYYLDIRVILSAQKPEVCRHKVDCCSTRTTRTLLMSELLQILTEVLKSR